MSVRWKSFLENNLHLPPFLLLFSNVLFKKINTDGGSRFLGFNFDGGLRGLHKLNYSKNFKHAFKKQDRLRICLKVFEGKAFRKVEQSSLN